MAEKISGIDFENLVKKILKKEYKTTSELHKKWIKVSFTKIFGDTILFTDYDLGILKEIAKILNK